MSCVSYFYMYFVRDLFISLWFSIFIDRLISLFLHRCRHCVVLSLVRSFFLKWGPDLCLYFFLYVCIPLFGSLCFFRVFVISMVSSVSSLGRCGILSLFKCFLFSSFVVLFRSLGSFVFLYFSHYLWWCLSFFSSWFL